MRPLLYWRRVRCWSSLAFTFLMKALRSLWRLRYRSWELPKNIYFPEYNYIFIKSRRKYWPFVLAAQPFSSLLEFRIIQICIYFHFFPNLVISRTGLKHHFLLIFYHPLFFLHAVVAYWILIIFSFQAHQIQIMVPLLMVDFTKYLQIILHS